MYKLEFTLKQHTPIIHFQHEQDGATLRATELKPKLDRFLIERYRQEIEPFIRKTASSDEYLDYKVKIREQAGDITFYYFDSTKPSKKELEKGYLNKLKEDLKQKLNINDIEIIFETSFFANRDKFKDKKWDEVKIGKMTNGEIKLEVIVFDLEIKEKLNELIPIFFVLENFGTRQNKGFGSFITTKLNKPSQIETELKNRFKVIKKYSFKENEQVTIEKKMKLISEVYKTMKNMPLKNTSILKEYYESDEFDQIFWEKEVTSNFAKGNEAEIAENQFYVRAMLGLANLYDYPTIDETLTISDAEANEFEEIQRFKSPIFFKPLGKTIYVVCYPVPKIMKGRTFKFTARNGDNFEIKTPWYFNENEFLNKLNWTNA